MLLLLENSFIFDFTFFSVKSSDRDPVRLNNRLIKKVCLNNYESNSYETERCREELQNLEVISREAEEICQQLDFDNEHDRKKCEKAAEICKKALDICERSYGPQTHRCQKLKEECDQLIKDDHILVKQLRKLGQNGQVSKINLQASIQGRQNKHSIKTGLILGIKTEDHGLVIKRFAKLVIELNDRTEYEVDVDSWIAHPKINYIWNTKKLLEEPLKLESKNKIRYGRKDHQEELIVDFSLEKTEEQKKSVRESPEFKQCLEFEEQDKVLAPLCMKARHQAASLDKLKLKIELPHKPKQWPVLLQVEGILKSLFIGRISVHEAPSSGSDKEIKVEVDFKRSGESAHATVEYSGLRVSVKNLRLQNCALNGLLPFGVEKRPEIQITKKLTDNMLPPSCRIEQTYVGTFDNRTYKYELNDCKHLLFKDCSNMVPVAVLAKSVAGPKSSKIVEILSGVNKIVLRPKSEHQANGMTVEVEIDGKRKTLEVSEGQTVIEKSDVTGEVEIDVKRYHDHVYKVRLDKMKLIVSLFLLPSTYYITLAFKYLCVLCLAFS